MKLITGADLTAARLARGWTKAELSRRSGVSYGVIQRQESVVGELNCRVSTFMALWEAFTGKQGKRRSLK